MSIRVRNSGRSFFISLAVSLVREARKCGIWRDGCPYEWKNIDFYITVSKAQRSKWWLPFQAKIDAVIHLASLKSVGESVARPLDYYRNNIVGSLNLIGVRFFLCRKPSADYLHCAFLKTWILDETYPSVECLSVSERDSNGNFLFFRIFFHTRSNDKNTHWTLTLQILWEPSGRKRN